MLEGVEPTPSISHRFADEVFDGEDDQQFYMVELIVVECISTSSNHGAVDGAHNVVKI